MTVNPRRALIIGGGVAGPVLALFLKRSGFDVQIFEASSGPADTGGALGLAANGMNVLAAVSSNRYATPASRLTSGSSKTSTASSSPACPPETPPGTARLPS
jgi:2-polyprenyl-6-methoxyphenol hydroxylase-like FAD-dependent oxidoreductase